MPDFNTDDEYYLAIKRFWKKYGNYLSGTLILFLAIFYGVRFWSYRVKIQEENASAMYIKFNRDFQNSQKSQERDKEVEQLLEKEAGSIAYEHPNTIYALFAQLTAAKLAVQNNDFVQAEQALQKALSSTNDKVLTSMVRLRLVRIYLAQNKLKKANTVFSSLPKESLSYALVLELKGDLLAKEKKTQQAKKAYKQAINQSNLVEQKEFIRIKMSNLM